MWRRRHRKIPPGDHITHLLLTRLGFILERHVFGEAEVTDWLTWLPEAEKQLPAAPQSTEEFVDNPDNVIILDHIMKTVDAGR